MPRGEQSALTARQTQTLSYLFLGDFETMDTQSSRQALPPKRLAWAENVQPIGPNNVATVPGAAPALTSVAGKTVLRTFYAFYNAIDFEIFFATDGSATQVNLTSGAQVTIAPPGTFTAPDVAAWQAQRILIADPTAGYCTWDGTAFVKSGGVSPVLTVTAGGSGYTTPTVTISGGSGSGATATATVVGGVVTSLQLTNAGTGYKAGDTITVTINPVGGGAGATATGKVWPQFSLTPTTLAVFAGRVWLAGGRTLTWTGTGGFDDSNPADASGSTIIPDSDVVHGITALRSLNNFLWIFGDNSIKQIGTVSVSGTTTIFTIVTLSSDTGTSFMLSIASYNRLVLFANPTGVYAVLGSSVQKLSDQMDGIFQNIDFSQAPQAALCDINSIRTYMLLVKYNDPVTNVTRALILVFFSRKWFVVNMGAGLLSLMAAPIASTQRAYGSSGSDVTQLLANNKTAVPILIRTAMAHHGKPHMNKRVLRCAVAQSATSSGTMSMTVDTENQSTPFPFNVSQPIKWLNALNQVVTWVNALAQQVIFSGVGFFFQRTQGAGTGIYLGMTLSGTFYGWSLNNIIIEYQDTTAMASSTDT